jgi:PAS domain S-box-containing protein
MTHSFGPFSYTCTYVGSSVGGDFLVFTPPDPTDVEPRNAEGPLSYSQEQIWSETFAHLGVAVAQLTLDGTLLMVNDRLCEVIGYRSRDLLAKDFRKFFQSAESQSRFETALSRLIAGKVYRYSTDMSAMKADGEVLWFRMFFSLIRDSATNTPRGLTVVAEDLTSLKQVGLERDELSRRMVGAQEADRTRIARELHDDIGQSLAILKIQMLRAGQPVSGDPKKTHADLRELARELEVIAQRVSHLSHGLHSSVLEYLGLAAAVKSHCRECSEQLRIPIECHCEKGNNKLDSVIALAFLRVVQEAIHNATKHSHAKGIVVRLSSSDRDLSLEISDDGVGFDVEGARLAEGLGLISMRERIHLVGGEFNIASSPGKGTRIVARVPNPPQRSLNSPS